ncbi:MAG: hypothetical protein GTN49_00205 [candidate division Zixibacteria bacterium]|nr:hypothetical protein [candidate division Zixibacteria bacterium]
MTDGDRPLEPKVLWYILSFIIFPLGIVLGIIYMQKPEPEVKAFGKNCLIAGIIMCILLCLCTVIFNVFRISVPIFRVS